MSNLDGLDLHARPYVKILVALDSDDLLEAHLENESWRGTVATFPYKTILLLMLMQVSKCIVIDESTVNARKIAVNERERE